MRRSHSVHFVKRAALLFSSLPDDLFRQQNILPSQANHWFSYLLSSTVGCQKKVDFFQLLVSETTRCCLFDPILPIVWSGDPKKQNKNLKMEEKHIFPYMCLTLSQGADINFKKCCVSEIDDIMSDIPSL